MKEMFICSHFLFFVVVIVIDIPFTQMSGTLEIHYFFFLFNQQFKNQEKNDIL